MAPAGGDSRDSVRLDRRRRLGHAIYGEHLMRQGVAGDVEPAAATICVAPALEMNALRVVAEEEVLAPALITRTKLGSRDVARAAADELALIARATPGTSELHHGVAPRRLSARCRRPPPHRSNGR